MFMIYRRETHEECTGIENMANLYVCEMCTNAFCNIVNNSLVQK